MPTLIIPIVENTFISKLFRKRNYASSPTLFSGKNNRKESLCRSLLKFDISSIPNSVMIKKASVRLYLYRNDVPSITKPLSLHNLLSPFNENTVSYINQPCFELAPASVLDITTEKNTFLRWDLTNLLRQWYKGDTPNYGICLTGLESDYSLTGFFSNNFSNSNLHPALFVNYSTTSNILQYPPEKVTSSPSWKYTTTIPLGDSIGTFGVQNSCTSGSAYVKLQISPDGINWIDDCAAYMSITEFSSGDNAVLTTLGFMKYVRAAYKSVKTNEPAKLVIYAVIKNKSC